MYGLRHKKYNLGRSNLRIAQPDHSNSPPLHLVLITRIPSAFFNGTQAASPHPVMLNSVPFFPPIGTIWCFSNRLISPALKVPGYSVLWAYRTLTRRSPATARNQNGGGVRTLINSDLSFQMVSLPHPHPLRPGFRLSLRQNQLPQAIPSSLPLDINSTHLYSRWLQYPSLHLGHPHLPRQC